MHYIGVSISQHISSDCQRQQLIVPPTVDIKPYSWVAFNRKRGGEIWSMPFKEVERASKVWPPKDVKPGDKVQGTLVEVLTNVNATSEKPLYDYILQTGKGEQTRVWGSSILVQTLGNGEKYLKKNLRLTFKGMIKAKQGKAKDFKVEFE